MPLNLYMCQWLWCTGWRPSWLWTSTQQCCHASYLTWNWGSWRITMWVRRKIMQQLCIGQYHLFYCSSTGQFKRHKSGCPVVHPVHLSIHLPIQHMLPETTFWLSHQKDRDLHPVFVVVIKWITYLSQKWKGNTYLLPSLSVTVTTLWETSLWNRCFCSEIQKWNDEVSVSLCAVIFP